MNKSLLTAPAQTERDEKKARVVAAAIWWVDNQACGEALMDLEEAVSDLMDSPSPAVLNLIQKERAA